MARKKSIKDIDSQLMRIKDLTTQLSKQRRERGESREGLGEREMNAILTASRYQDNIRNSKAYDNSARRMDFWERMAGKNDDVKFSQRTYMGLSNG